MHFLSYKNWVFQLPETYRATTAALPVATLLTSSCVDRSLSAIKKVWLLLHLIERFLNFIAHHGVTLIHLIKNMGHIL